MDVFTTPVQVTTGRPCYNKSKGLRINQNQAIASFFMKAFPSPVEVKPYHNSKEKPSTLSRIAATAVSVGRGSNEDMILSFMRTVRIPEDRHDYDLPPGLGPFPLFDIGTFSDSLPPQMVAQGGLFLPMYRKSHLLFFHSLFVSNELVPNNRNYRNGSNVDQL